MRDGGNDCTRREGYGQPWADIVLTDNWDGISYGDITGGDGRRHAQNVVIPVSASPGTASFTPGKATVSVFILDENTLTEYATDTRTVKVC